MLTAELACEVFLLKQPSDRADQGGKLSSLHVSRKYGVSAKTVRDIWNRSAASRSFFDFYVHFMKFNLLSF